MEDKFLLPKVYNQQVPLEEKLPDFDYERFMEAAKNCGKQPELVMAPFQKVHPNLELREEDVTSAYLCKRDKHTSKELKLLYGLPHFYNLSLTIPDRVWYGNGTSGLRERLDLPDDAIGCLLPSVFVGEQESFPLSLITEYSGKFNYYNELGFIYKIVNGYAEQDYKKGVQQLHKLFLQKLFSLSFEVLWDNRSWDSSRDNQRRSVKEEGEAYIETLSKEYCGVAEHKEGWQSLWQGACDVLKGMEGDYGLISYSLLGAEELSNFTGWKKQLEIREEGWLKEQLVELLDIKTQGGDVEELGANVRTHLLKTLK